MSDDESSAISTQPPSSVPSSSSVSSVSSDFVREMRDLLIGSGLGRGNAYDNLQYDPYGNEAIQDRFSEPSQAPPLPDQQRSPTPPLPDQQRSPTTPPPAQQRSPTPASVARQRSSIPFAVDVYEELAEDNPGISVEEAGRMLAADVIATQNDIREFNKGTQSIFTTAKSMGRKHGRSGKQMQGKYFHMQEYIDSYLTGRGESDAKNFMTMDPDMLSIDAEDFYKNSFAKIKNQISQGTEKRQTRAKTRNEAV